MQLLNHIKLIKRINLIPRLFLFIIKIKRRVFLKLKLPAIMARMVQVVFLLLLLLLILRHERTLSSWGTETGLVLFFWLSYEGRSRKESRVIQLLLLLLLLLPIGILGHLFRRTLLELFFLFHFFAFFYHILALLEHVFVLIAAHLLLLERLPWRDFWFYQLGLPRQVWFQFGVFLVWV